MQKEQSNRRAMAPPQPAVSLFDSETEALQRGKARSPAGAVVTTYESTERPGFHGYRIEPPDQATPKMDPPAEPQAAATRTTGGKKGGAA